MQCGVMYDGPLCQQELAHVRANSHKRVYASVYIMYEAMAIYFTSKLAPMEINFSNLINTKLFQFTCG
jgi:hypothetical protein